MKEYIYEPYPWEDVTARYQIQSRPGVGDTWAPFNSVLYEDVAAALYNMGRLSRGGDEARVVAIKMLVVWPKKAD